MTGTYPFLRPDLLRDRSGILALYITGVVLDANPGDPYEGRLQVHNAVGDFSILSVTGDLPPGSDVFADNGSDQIVIRWPAYNETASEIPNGDFSTGTMDNWTVTKLGENPSFPAHASVNASRPPAGSTYSGFWQGNTGTGHAGGVEAVWENSFEGVVGPGRQITVSAQIALDDTDSSQNRGRVRIHFYNEFDVLLNPDDVGGNIIRGNDENYQTSSVTRTSPPATVYAKAAVWTTANASSGSGVRFGNVTWDLPDVVGVNTTGLFCNTIVIRDSAGRTAQWNGCINVLSSAIFAYNFNSPVLLRVDSIGGATTPVTHPAGNITDGFAEGGALFLVGSLGAYVSFNRGASWSAVSFDVAPSLSQIIWSDFHQKWIATSASLNTGIYSSPDGINFTKINWPGYGCYGVACRGPSVVVGNTLGRVTHTTDLVLWSNGVPAGMFGTVNSIIDAGPVFVADGGGTYFTDADGTGTWSTLGIAVGSSRGIMGVSEAVVLLSQSTNATKISTNSAGSFVDGPLLPGFWTQRGHTVPVKEGNFLVGCNGRVAYGNGVDPYQDLFVAAGSWTAMVA